MSLAQQSNDIMYLAQQSNEQYVPGSTIKLTTCPWQVPGRAACEEPEGRRPEQGQQAPAGEERLQGGARGRSGQWERGH